MPSWEWDHVWLMYSIWGMIIFPWGLVSVTVPQLGEIYAAASNILIAKIIVFGAMWGMGSVAFGIGTKIVGNSLGFSIILGLTSTLGNAIVSEQQR